MDSLYNRNPEAPEIAANKLFPCSIQIQIHYFVSSVQTAFFFKHLVAYILGWQDPRTVRGLAHEAKSLVQ